MVKIEHGRHCVLECMRIDSPTESRAVICFRVLPMLTRGRSVCRLEKAKKIMKDEDERHKLTEELEELML